jgi:hypothetical protein
MPGHSFATFVDLGFNSAGTMYVLGSDNHVYTVAQDLSHIVRVPADDAGSDVAVYHLFMDGDDVYTAGCVGNYAYYWKNGVRHLLESAPGSRWTEANDVFVKDGSVYVVGCSWDGFSTYRMLLWIDGQAVHDDRSIEETFDEYYIVRPHAVHVGEVLAAAKTPVTGLALSNQTLDVPVGYSLDLTAHLTPANATNKHIVWTSSAPAVASVSGRGQTIAVGGVSIGGPVTVRATSVDGPAAACTVNVVNVPVAGVSVSPSTLALAKARQFRLNAAIEPYYATDKNVAWSSSAPSIASIA